jgi:hypothetical protein
LKKLFTMTSVKYIISGIEYPTLKTINVRPTYEIIHKICRQIYTNAASVDSHSGGINGHLGQLMLPAAYLTVSAAPFTTSPKPGPLPPRPANLFPQQWEDVKATHKLGLDEYTTSYNLDKSVKQHIIKAIVEPIFLKPLENHVSGYSRVATRAMIHFLFNSYGNITPLQLDENYKMMK